MSIRLGPIVEMESALSWTASNNAKYITKGTTGLVSSESIPANGDAPDDLWLSDSLDNVATFAIWCEAELLTGAFDQDFTNDLVRGYGMVQNDAWPERHWNLTGGAMVPYMNTGGAVAGHDGEFGNTGINGTVFANGMAIGGKRSSMCVMTSTLYGNTIQPIPFVAVMFYVKPAAAITATAQFRFRFIYGDKL